MKKLLLVSTVLFGAALASQAAVRVNIGIGLPFPPPVIFSHPAPVVVAQAPACDPYAVISAPAPVCAPPPRVVYEPYCEPAPVVIAPRPVYYPDPYRHHGYYGYGRQGWEHEGHSHGYGYRH